MPTRRHVARGEWKTERSVVAHVNDLYAIIADAWREFQAGRIETWWSVSGEQVEGRTLMFMRSTAGQPVPKPDGFCTCIARLVICLSDTIGQYGNQCEPTPGEMPKSLPAFVASLYVNVAALINWHTFTWSHETSRLAKSIVAYCLEFSAHERVDLWPIIDEVLAYDAARGGKA